MRGKRQARFRDCPNAVADGYARARDFESVEVNEPRSPVAEFRGLTHASASSSSRSRAVK